jgi:hypothetical protein
MEGHFVRSANSVHALHAERHGDDLEAVNCVVVKYTSFKIIINGVTWVFSPVKEV